MLLEFLLLYLCTFVYAQSSVNPKNYDPFSISALCPFPCRDDVAKWALYSDATELANCNKTVLISLNLYNEDDQPTVPIHSCVVEGGPSDKFLKRQQPAQSTKKNETNPSTLANQTVKMSIFRQPGLGEGILSVGIQRAGSADILTAATALAGHLSSDFNSELTALFSKAGNAILGAYVGKTD